MWHIRTASFEILIGTNSSQISNFRRMKNSNIFESRTNLSHVWNIRTYLSQLKNSWQNTYAWRMTNSTQTSFVMRSYLSDVCRLLWNLECRYLTLSQSLHLLTCMFIKTWISLVLAQLEIEASIIAEFHSNPSSIFWGDAITRKNKDDRRWPCLSTGNTGENDSLCTILRTLYFNHVQYIIFKNQCLKQINKSHVWIEMPIWPPANLAKRGYFW